MVTIEQIKERIKESIKQSGKTQKEIAEKIGVKQPTIAHYIKGDIMPGLDTLANLCVVLDLDANDILCIR